MLGLLLSTLLSSAQSKFDKIYNTFDNTEGVTNFTFTKEMVDAFNIDLGSEGEERELMGDLQKIRFLSYNPEKGNLSGDDFIKKAVALLPSKYKKYDAHNEGSGVGIWLLGKKRKYSECHVFVNNNKPAGNSFIVSFYGNFKVSDLEALKETGKGMSSR